MIQTPGNHDTRRSRGWVFTINNFTKEEKQHVMDIINDPRVSLGIAEIEHEGEGEGTPHIQGYIYFENARYFNAAKNLIGERAHIDVAKGNPEQNYDYCSKEDKVFAMRPLTKRMKKQGGFLEMYEDMKIMKPEEFELKYPKFMVMHREKVMQVMIANAMTRVKEYDGKLPDKNWWIWGEPGVGKSRWAAMNGEYSEIFKKNFNKWWDGYNLLSTKIVIIEDYPCAPQGNALVQHMKIWGDRYPFEGECKGSHMMIEPRRFFLIVTSNYPIDLCFENEEDKKAIKRRFNECHMEKGDLMSMGDFILDKKIITEENQ